MTQKCAFEAPLADILNLARIKALPYVDIFVADASKRAYLDALRTGKNSCLRADNYWARCAVVSSLDEALVRLR